MFSTSANFFITCPYIEMNILRKWIHGKAFIVAVRLFDSSFTGTDGAFTFLLLEEEDILKAFSSCSWSIGASFVFRALKNSFSGVFRELCRGASPPSLSSTWLTTTMPVSGCSSDLTRPAVYYVWNVSGKRLFMQLLRYVADTTVVERHHSLGYNVG